MAWLFTHTATSVTHNRTNRSSQVKCDRAEPSCGWCSRNNRVCVYQERRKPGLRIAYVHDLEEKVNRLEAVLHSLGRRVEDHISEHDVLHGRNSNGFSYTTSLTPRSEVPRSIPSETLSHRSPTVDTQWQTNGFSREHRLPEPMSVRSVLDNPAPDLRPHLSNFKGLEPTP